MIYLPYPMARKASVLKLISQRVFFFITSLTSAPSNTDLLNILNKKGSLQHVEDDAEREDIDRAVIFFRLGGLDLEDFRGNVPGSAATGVQVFLIVPVLG